MCERPPSINETACSSDDAAERAVTERVQRFYEHFHFPGIRPLDRDGLILMRHLTGCLRSPQGKKPRLLDAGCGTGNTVVSLAHQFRDIDFLGVDLSAPSLAIARQSATDANLQNLRFRQWNLLDPDLREDPFDVVLCLGVLHHTANLPVALANLRSVLSDRGTLYLWVYGKHGRYRHSLNRRLLDMLLSAGSPGDDPVELARELLLNSGSGGGNGAGSVSLDLFGASLPDSLKERVVELSAWIADQFLSPTEVLLTMESLLPLVRGGGLEIAQWLGCPENPSSLLGSVRLLERYDRLDRDKQLIAMDLLLKPERYFVVLRKPCRHEADSS